MQKDPKLALTKSGTLFISYLTAAYIAHHPSTIYVYFDFLCRAQDAAAKAGHKTINGNHVLAALEQIGFGEWADPLRQRVEQYMAQKAKKPTTAAEDDDDEDANEPDTQQPETVPDTTTEMEEEEEADDASGQADDDNDNDKGVEDDRKRVKLDELLAIQDFEDDS